MNKRFPRKAFPPGTLMVYKKSGKNYMFVVTETTNDGKINVIATKKNRVNLFLANSLYWNHDFDTNTWKFVLPRIPR